MADKQSWPELVGMEAEEAKAVILSENSKLEVHVLPEICPVTMDYREDRVRIFKKDDGTVAAAPMIG